MTIQTERQISRMKAQTFGVEVECNSITRRCAAETATALFGGTGQPERGNGDEYAVRDPEGREWRFHRDSSIRGPEEQKCEVITPILHYGDIPLLQALIRKLRKAGAKSSPSRGCGVHVHVGLKSETGDHDARTLRNLANLMAAHEEQIGRAIRLEEHRRDEYCRMISPAFLEAVNAEKPITMEALAEIWYRTNDAAENRETRYNRSRYHMLNLHSAFLGETVEFRLFQFDEPHAGRKGGLHAGELKAYIQLCLAMSQRAKDARFVCRRPQQAENDKYAFRCWLMGLGLIGEEFRTARLILLRNMEGNAAWR